MRTAMVLPLLALGALAAAGPGDSGVAVAVREIYAPYTTPAADGSDPAAAWNRGIYTRDVEALISQWTAVAPEDEVDDLGDGDWLCMCQDWDARLFKAAIISVEPAGEDAATVEVSVAVFGTDPRRARLSLRREDGAWKLDDIVSEDMPQGLRQALRDTIAKDEALAAGKTTR